jgi:hypothetical protein
MSDQTLSEDALGPTIAAPATPAFDPVTRSRELAVLDALRAVVDPEIGMNVVGWLIRQVILGDELTKIEMMLHDALLSVRRLHDPAGQGGGRNRGHEVRSLLAGAGMRGMPA